MQSKATHTRTSNGQWLVDTAFLSHIANEYDAEDYIGSPTVYFEAIEPDLFWPWYIPEKLLKEKREMVIGQIWGAIQQPRAPNSPVKRVAERAVSTRKYPPGTTVFIDVLKRLMEYFNAYSDNLDPLEGLLKNLQLAFLGLCREQALVHFLNDYNEFIQNIDLWQSQPQPYTAKVLAGDCKELIGKLKYLVRVK